MPQYCSTCGDKINHSHLEGKQETSKSGLGLECPLCRNDTITQDRQVQAIFSEQLVEFFKNTLGLPLDEWDIQVKLCEQHELRVTSQSSLDQVHTGECISSLQVHHVRAANGSTNDHDDLIHTRTVKEIRLLKGMHVELVARTIAHEAMHGWIALWYGQPCGIPKCTACPAKLSDVVAEGLCEYAGFAFLEYRQKGLAKTSHRYQVIEYTKSKMLTNTSGVYAQGLRLARAAFLSNGSHLNRLKNAAFFKQVFALGTFPTEGKVSTPVKHNQVTASLGSCQHCACTIEPSSTTEFEFVVLGDSGAGSGAGGSSRNRNRNSGRGNKRTEPNCVCLPCYELAKPKCKWCQIGLHKKTCLQNQNIHRDCFLAYEEEYGDKCHVCGETLWEVEESGESGSFVRRSSYTSNTGSFGSSGSFSSSRPPSNHTKRANDGTRREVHVRCGDRCSYCSKLFVNEQFILVENQQLHSKCLYGYQQKIGLVCGICSEPLWTKTTTTKSTSKSSFERRTRVMDGNEIHVECGPTCYYCKTLLDGKFITLGPQKKIHEKCFDAYQCSIGQTCGICSEPLWRRGDGSKDNSKEYGRRTCKIKNKKTGQQDLEVHVDCNLCVYCHISLLKVSPHETKRGRRGSVVTVDLDKDDQVHDACFLLYQATKPSECCHECGSGLWRAQKDKSFARRSSVTKKNGNVIHMCETCAASYREYT